MTAVHDGPVQEISKCPFMPHLLMSVGGYSFAIWNEGVMVCIFNHGKRSESLPYYTPRELC